MFVKKSLLVAGVILLGFTCAVVAPSSSAAAYTPGPIRMYLDSNSRGGSIRVYSNSNCTGSSHLVGKSNSASGKSYRVKAYSSWRKIQPSIGGVISEGNVGYNICKTLKNDGGQYAIVKTFSNL